VGFTHTAENVLDKVRSGDLKLDSSLVALLLDCRDYVGWLINAVEAEREVDADVVAEGQVLTDRLLTFLEHSITSYSGEIQVASIPNTVEREPQQRALNADHWHLSIRFGPGVLQNGMDPLSFLNYLGRIGRIIHVETLFDALPELDSYDPELCYVGFEVNLESAADKKAIEEVFEFVRDECCVRIIPPP